MSPVTQIEHCRSCGRGRYLGKDDFYCECGEEFLTNRSQLQTIRRQVGADCVLASVVAEGRSVFTAPHGWTELADCVYANTLNDSQYLRVTTRTHSH